MNDVRLTSRMTGIFVVLAAAQLCVAQDWPQWRGPARDGAATGFTAPKTWPQKLGPIWRVPIGTGHSSPVVVGRRVYILSRQGDEEVVSCINFETGRLMWRDRYPAPYTMDPAAVSQGKGPKSTPVVQDGKLFTLGISGVLSCYDITTGSKKWRKEFSNQFKATSPLYGTATSPLVHKGLVIVHVGGNDSGALTAFDAETGDVKWSWNGDGPGYASPVVTVLAGVEQVVTQSQKFIVALSPATGEVLWRIPFETEYAQNSITPVVYKETLIFSGYEKGTIAVKPFQRAGKWETQQVWTNTQVSMYLSSPVVSGDYLYGLSYKRKGQFFCLDARTGQIVWTSNGREGDNAAIVLADGLLFMLSDGAALTIARVDRGRFEVVKKYTVAQSPTWAHPVIVGNRVLIKDASNLALLGLD